MTAPVRRRPGASPIQSLTPRVEEVRTARVEGSAPALDAAPMAIETSRDVRHEPSTAVLAQGTPVPTTTTVPFAATVNAPAAAEQVTVAAPEQGESDDKKATTLAIRRSIKARAETAVLRTAGFEGGYRSWAAFVEGALERELERLEQEFNDGERFPANTGSFRQGRPLGS